MDKRTQEEVEPKISVSTRSVYSLSDETKEEQRKKRVFSWDCSVICKGCQRIHQFRSFDNPMLFVRFPKGDFSVVELRCPLAKGTHTYQSEELLWPVGDIQPSKIEQNLNEINQRLSRLEETVGKGERDKNEKSIRDRLASMETTLTSVVERVTETKAKEPPKGQHA